MSQQHDIPKIVWWAVALTFFNSWVLFEETVVDRYGLWRHMPLYRVAKACAWDIAAIAVIGGITAMAMRPQLRRSAGRFCPLRACSICAG